MRKYLLMALFVAVFTVGRQPIEVLSFTDIEVFDVKQGKVIKHIANTKEIQEEVKICIHKITGLSGQLSVDPKDGLIYHIPVEPPVMLNNQWLNVQVNEVYLIVPLTQKPQLLLFDEENKPYLVDFDHDLRSFLEKVNH